ncbi:MAG TPA: glyoxalase superfamily protein [Luteolibacter sp.]
MNQPIPILRMFDVAKAKEHYVGFLGFKLDWEHRFDSDLPLYMQVSRDRCILHLSEHFGDATPGSAFRVETPNLDEFCEEIRTKNYRNAKIGDPAMQPWGTREISITDPFGNRMIFYCAEKNVQSIAE